jgi:hypothetical protein
MPGLWLTFCAAFLSPCAISKHRGMQVRCSLYGSRPPANDSLWAIAKKLAVFTISFLAVLCGVETDFRKRQSAQYLLRPRLPNLFRVIRANMGCKLLVPLQLEVVHHFIERGARGRSEGLNRQLHSEQPKPRKCCFSIHTSFRLSPPLSLRANEYPLSVKKPRKLA